MKSMSRLLCVVLGSVLLSTGCRTAINPHIVPTFQATSCASKPCAHQPNFEDVVSGAVGLRDNYRKAVGNQAKFQNILSLALLGAGAATAFVGGTSSHSGNDAVFALSLASAAATTTGLRLTSRDRDLLYLLGSEAISCSLEAATPFMMDDTQSNKLKTLEEFSTLIATVDGCRLSLPAEAADRVENAGKVLAEAVKLQSTRLQAANHLRESVERTADQINTGVISTRASLVTLQESIQGLADMARGFRGVDLGTPQPAPQGVGSGRSGIAPFQPQPLEIDTKCLDAFAKMKQDAIFFNAIVSTVEKKAEDLNLSACGVTVPKSGPRFRPETKMAFVVGVSADQTRLLGGGEPPYTLRLTAPVNGLEIETNHLTYVTLKATDQLTEPGDYGLLLSDTTGTESAAALEVEVKENQRPTAMEAAVKKTSKEAFTIQVQGFDPERQKLEFETLSKPDPNKGELTEGKCAGSVRADAAVPDTFNYCYTPKNPDEDGFTFRVIDAAGQESMAATVQIEANQPPTAMADSEVEAPNGIAEFEIVGTDPENQALEFCDTFDVNDGKVESVDGTANSGKVTFKLDDGKNEGSFKFCVVDDFKQKSDRVEVKIVRKP